MSRQRIKKQRSLGALTEGITEAQRRANNALSFLHFDSQAVGLGDWYTDRQHMGNLDPWAAMNAWGKSVEEGTKQAVAAVTQAAQQTINAVQTGTKQAAAAVGTQLQKAGTTISNATNAILHQDSGVAPKRDPKITATAQNFVDVANANLSKALGPELNAMAIVMGLNDKDKATLIQSPINFFLHFFNPVIDYLHTMIDRVTQRTGKINRKLSPFSSNTVDMRTVHPNDAASRAKDPDTFDFYWTMRTIGQFIVCCLTCPLIVADEAIKIMLKQPVGTDKNWDLGRQGLGVVGVDDGAIALGTAQTAGEATAVATATAPGWIEGLMAVVKQLGDFLNKTGIDPVRLVSQFIPSATPAVTPNGTPASGQKQPPPTPVDNTLLYGAGVLGLAFLLLK